MALPEKIDSDTNISEFESNKIVRSMVQMRKDLEEYKEIVSELRATISDSFTDEQAYDKLYQDLAKAQLEMGVASMDAVNPFFQSKYAQLSHLVKASRPFLAKHGLSVIHLTKPNKEGKLFLSTRLLHNSGQFMESVIEVKPAKDDIQSLGKCLTYLKRYQYAALVGVVASDDEEDDDGESEMEEPRLKNKVSARSSKISKAQLQVLSDALSSYPDILEHILKGYKIKKMSDLLSEKYNDCIERVRRIKKAKED